jgi:dTDP-4-dehydrorhamnose reductase
VGRLTRTLVTGATGMLGRELVRELGDEHEVLTPRFDVCDRDATVGAITSLRPDVVVHAAAWTDVDGCETDPDRAFRTNALGTRNVADGARRAGAHVVAVSTDYVFDGTATQPYVEWDATNPLSVYGRSKLGGEHELDPGWAVVRTSWLFAAHGRSFVRSVLERDGELRVVDDQHGCPTAAPDLARMIRLLAAARLPGTFHVTNQGATTWWQLARDVLAVAGRDPERVVPIPSSELDRPAPRPARSVLDNAALRLAGIGLLPDHHDPLEQIVKELTSP